MYPYIYIYVLMKITKIIRTGLLDLIFLVYKNKINMD
jgi:hypothetical protein